MLIERAEIEGRGPLDVRIEAERIQAIGSCLAPRPGESSLTATASRDPWRGAA